MKALEEKILKEGQVISKDILKVGSFLNQQLDAQFMHEMGKEIHRIFKDCGVTKVLTIEASGIAIAVAAAFYFQVPAVFAKKSKSSNVAHEVLTSCVKSFTRGITYEICVSSEYICKGDKVLIVDDFLASGSALCGLIEIVESAGAEVVGVSAAIEKGFQGGGDALREKGVRVESLAIIDEMSEGSVRFR